MTYKPPTLNTRAQDQTDPKVMHPQEFHPNISSASGRWQPCECHNGNYEAHFNSLTKILKDIIAQDARKKAK